MHCCCFSRHDMAHQWSGTFLLWFFHRMGGLWAAGGQLLWPLAVHHKCMLEGASVQDPFLAEGKYSGLQTPPRPRSTVLLGGGCMCLCVCKANCCILFQRLSKQASKTRTPGPCPKGRAAWKAFSCLKTGWFKTILESMRRCQRGPPKRPGSAPLWAIGHHLGGELASRGLLLPSILTPHLLFTPIFRKKKNLPDNHTLTSPIGVGQKTLIKCQDAHRISELLRIPFWPETSPLLTGVWTVWWGCRGDFKSPFLFLSTSMVKHSHHHSTSGQSFGE